VEPTAHTRPEFIEECKSGKLDGVVAAYRTFGSVSITGLIDEELVKALPESLKFLCHNGAYLLSYYVEYCENSSCPNGVRSIVS